MFIRYAKKLRFVKGQVETPRGSQKSSLQLQWKTFTWS